MVSIFRVKLLSQDSFPDAQPALALPQMFDSKFR